MAELGGPNAKLPIYTQILLDLSNLCVKDSIIPNVPNLLFVIVAGTIGVSYLLKYIKTPKGKYKFHGVLLKTPVVKIIILKVAVARFSRTFASLMGAGVSVLDALDVTGAALGNKVIEKELKAAAEEVRNGKPLSEPISTATSSFVEISNFL